jgi:hypothetical protein
MALINPYNNRGMLPVESDMFFGRDKEMQRIENMLVIDRPQCVSMVGVDLWCQVNYFSGHGNKEKTSVHMKGIASQQAVGTGNKPQKSQVSRKLAWHQITKSQILTIEKKRRG